MFSSNKTRLRTLTSDMQKKHSPPCKCSKCSSSNDGEFKGSFYLTSCGSMQPHFKCPKTHIYRTIDIDDLLRQFECPKTQLPEIELKMKLFPSKLSFNRNRNMKKHHDLGIFGYWTHPCCQKQHGIEWDIKLHRKDRI